MSPDLHYWVDPFSLFVHTFSWWFLCHTHAHTNTHIYTCTYIFVRTFLGVMYYPAPYPHPNIPNNPNNFSYTCKSVCVYCVHHNTGTQNVFLRPLVFILLKWELILLAKPFCCAGMQISVPVPSFESELLIMKKGKQEAEGVGGAPTSPFSSIH